MLKDSEPPPPGPASHHTRRCLGSTHTLTASLGWPKLSEGQPLETSAVGFPMHQGQHTHTHKHTVGFLNIGTWAYVPVLLPARFVNGNNLTHSHLLHHLNGYNYNNCLWLFFSVSNNKRDVIVPVSSKTIYKMSSLCSLLFLGLEY